MASKTAYYLNRLISKFTRDKNIPPAHQYLGLDLSLKAMALMSAADGNIDDAEIELAREVYESNARSVVKAETIDRAIKIVVDDEPRAWHDFSVASELDEEIRADILQVAARMAMADGDLVPEEAALLHRIGEALGLSDHYIDGLLESCQQDVPGGEAPEVDEEALQRLSRLINTSGGDELHHLLGTLFHGGSNRSAEQQSTSMDLTLKAMALMCLADGDVDDAELRLTGEIYAALSGGKVAERTLKTAIGIVQADPTSAWDDFSRAHLLDAQAREDILRAAYYVANIDEHVDESEVKTLNVLGQKLGFSAADVDRIAKS